MSPKTEKLVAEANRLSALYRETTEAADRIWSSLQSKVVFGVLPKEASPELVRLIEVLYRLEVELLDARHAATVALFEESGMVEDPTETLSAFYSPWSTGGVKRMPPAK